MLVRWCFEVVDEVMMKLTSVKLVNTADPLEVALRKIVEGDEVVVTGNAVNRSNTDFVETLEEVFSHVNWLLEVGVAHDCGLIGKLLGEIKVDMEG
jgi:ATP:corrinoid adenosyltransferase